MTLVNMASRASISLKIVIKLDVVFKILIVLEFSLAHVFVK